MANHPSAIKRAKQNIKRRERNKRVKSAIKTQIKKVLMAMEEKKADKVKEQFRLAVSLIDKGASKGVLHRNNAARKISRLSRKVNKFLASREAAA